MNLRSREQELLSNFAQYLTENPGQRFWQALRNWSGYSFIYASDSVEAKDAGLVEDTFYWNDRNGTTEILALGAEEEENEQERN